MAKKVFVIAASITCAALLAMAILTSSIFQIAVVEVEGAVKVTKKDIANAGISSDVNIFSISIKKATEYLLKNPYVSKVEIKRIFPDKVRVKLTERRGRTYIEYIGKYILVDEQGAVITVQTAVSDLTLPIVTGLSFDSFVVGEKLVVDQPSAFEQVVFLSKIFEKYNLDDVSKIDVENTRDVHFYVGKWDIAIGDCTVNTDEKVRFFTQARQQGKMPDFRGVFDLRDAGKNQFIFTISQ